MRPIRRARVVARNADGMALDCGDGLTCRVSVLHEHLGRVLVLRDGGVRQPRTWMVPSSGEADVPWAGRDRLASPFPSEGVLPHPAAPDGPAHPAPHSQEEGVVVVRAGRLSVRVTLDPFRIEWLWDGQVFLADRPGMATMLARHTDAVAHHAVRHPADRYYGLGDKTGPLDLHGRRLRTAMRDALGYDPRQGDPLYKHWPFLLTRCGVTGIAYGMLYDNHASATFDLGAEHDNYHGLYRSYEAEGGDLDYYVMPGPALADVTPHFLRLTGGTALPPRWSLGYAQTAMAIADAPDAQAQIAAFIGRCAAEDVPISAFHFGSGYTSIGRKRYIFHWNRAKFPEPEALVQRFHDAGIRVVANLKPCLLDDHPQYAAATPGFVTDGTRPLLSQFWDGEGAHVDFTNPAGIAWWQKGLTAQVLAPGIDAGWNDNNEYELWDEDATCHNFGTPTPLALLRPVQPLLMTRATIEAQQAHTKERPFTVTRAGMPGVQRYAQSWSGDNTTSWETLRWNLRTGLQMSLSGLYNIGHDIGGFAGPVPDPELLIRWTQTGVVHPRFIMNSWKPDGVFTNPLLHPTALPAIRRAIRLRYRLMPYLYSLMHHAATRHEPVLRPTFLQFPDDPGCVADCDELMLGPSLLAAPVVEPGARVRTLHLPHGPECWFDWHSGETLAPGHATVAAPLDQLPLLLPAGAILPLTARRGLHDEPSRLLLVCPGPGHGESAFTLVEDDGITPGGPATRVIITLSWTPHAVVVRVAASGDFPLPEHMTVALPDTERRPVRLESGPGAPALQHGPFSPGGE